MSYKPVVPYFLSAEQRRQLHTSVVGGESDLAANDRHAEVAQQQEYMPIAPYHVKPADKRAAPSARSASNQRSSSAGQATTRVFAAQGKQAVVLRGMFGPVVMVS